MDRWVAARIVLALLLVPLALALLLAPNVGLGVRLLGVLALGVFAVGNGALQRRSRHQAGQRITPPSSWR